MASKSSSGVIFLGLPLVFAGLVSYAGNAVIFVTVEPCGDCAPSELSGDAFFVSKSKFGNIGYAFMAVFAFGRVNSSQNAHF